MKILFFACAGLHSLFAFANENKIIISGSFENCSAVIDIIEVHSFAQIVEEIDDPEALIFIDIDDTLIDFDMHIGCKQWRAYIKNTPLKNYHDHLTLYIAKQILMVPVEKDMPALIKELQRKGRYLFPLTARERDCWYALDGIPHIDVFTYQTLFDAQFDFEQTSHPSYFHLMNQDTFYRGIYFSQHPFNAETSKGDTIKQLLAHVLARMPSQEIKIYFIDDKREQCESVLSAIKELGITGRVYWYRACEKNHRDFDFAASLIQLENLLSNHIVLSNEEASAELKRRGNPTPAQLLEDMFPHGYLDDCFTQGIAIP